MTQFKFLGSLHYIICRPLVRLSIANVNDRSNYSDRLKRDAAIEQPWKKRFRVIELYKSMLH